jgi:hypothetical protein
MVSTSSLDMQTELSMRTKGMTSKIEGRKFSSRKRESHVLKVCCTGAERVGEHKRMEVQLHARKKHH